MSKKIIIKESQIDALRLPKFIYKAISQKYTSLGDNPAIPQYGDFGFEYDAAKNRFLEVTDKIDEMISDGIIESKNEDYLISVLGKMISKCLKIERTVRQQLQKLCENIVNAKLAIPLDTVILKCNLVDEVNTDGMRILPESGDNSGYDFDDVDEINLSNKVILKRRFINSLIQGFAYILSDDINEWEDDINKIHPELWDLWMNITSINDYLVFVKEEKISDKNPMQNAYVKVRLGKKGKKTIISCEGLLFPFLLKETFKGFFELFSSHGLPKDNEKAMYIIRKADFLVAEPWDIRLGVPIVERIKNVMEKYNIDIISETKKLPYFFTDLCKLKTDEFNDLIQNVLSATKKGNRILSRMNDNIVNDLQYQEFKDKIQKKNLEVNIINDGYMTPDELDNFVIQETSA